MFDEPAKLILGLITGVLFGFLLQKGRVAKVEMILGQLRLKDWTVLRIMSTAIAVGAIGVNTMIMSGIASLHIQPASLARVTIGGTLFGVGLAIFGLCPGTSVAACGEGRKDAMVGVFGMLCGAALYVVSFGVLQPLFNAFPDFGKTTLPQITGTSRWLWVAGAGVVLLMLRIVASHRNWRASAVSGPL